MLLLSETSQQIVSYLVITLKSFTPHPWAQLLNTWIREGITGDLVTPIAALIVSTTDSIWQKYIMSAMVWNVS